MRNKLMSILLFYIVAWCIAPPLSYGGIFRLLALFCICLLCFLFILKNGNRINLWQIIIVFAVLYIILLCFITNDGLSSVVGICIMFALLFMKESVFKESNIFKDEKWFIPAVFILCIVFNITTLIGIAEEPNIMRILAKNTENGPSYASRGVGGYGYMYTILLIIPLGIKFLFDKNNNIFNKLIACAFIITSYILSFKSQYFLVILLVILLTILFFIFRIKNRGAKISILILMLLLFLFVLFNAEFILKEIMSGMDSTGAIYRKLRDIYNMIHGTSIEDTEFAVRFERYSRTINVIFESPLWGKFSKSFSGNHSVLLDILAQYGIPIGLLICYLILIRPFIKVNLGGIENVLFITLFLITLLNVIPFACASVFSIIMPIYSQTYNEEEVA